MLHIVNKSACCSDALASALRLARTGALLLIEDAIYAATRGHPAETRVLEALERMTVYVLAPDAQARGMSDRITPGVIPVDYAGFVELVVEHPNCQSWL